jgi:hypothetical protein
MTVLTAYFDASGHPAMKDGAMFVSGFISSAEKWLKFDAGWKALLDEYGIENPFHMTDFANRAQQYASWGDDKAKRIAFCTEAVALMKRHTFKDFSQGIVLADYRRIRSEYLIPKGHAVGMWDAPYVYCGVGAFVQVVKWVRRRAAKKNILLEGPVELIYDRNEQDRGLFAAAMKKSFKVTPIERSAANATPIQAADMIAWEHARRFTQKAQKQRIERASLLHMSDQLPGSGEWVVSTYQGMREYCEDQGFQKRNAQ